MEEDMAERILITGGEGFLGKHLQAYYFSKAINYDTLDVVGEPHVAWDITMPLYLHSDYTKVVHLAGVLGTHELFDDVMKAIDVNITGTVRVLQYCAERGVPFHGVTMAHVWVNPYETTKLAAERLAEAWGREYDFPVKYTTVYNAYGEHQAHGPGHPQKIIPTFATKAWAKEPLPIWGDGTQKVDLVWANHVANIIGNDDEFDGGYGVGWTVLEVAGLVWEMVNPGTPLRVEHLPMRRGEHAPAHDPIAQNPCPGRVIFGSTLQKTIESYRNEDR